MLCPLCRGRSPAGSTSCALCGVDFMKWLKLQGARPKKTRRGGGLWLPAALVLALPLLFWRARGTQSAPHAPPPAASAPAVDRVGQVHARALEEGRLYGVELMRDELEKRYEDGRRALLDPGLSASAADVGLAGPVEAPLRDDEAALSAKCLENGAWSYGSLPRLPRAGLECWAAGAGYPRRWVRQNWHHKRRVWSAFPEAEAARAAHAIAARRYDEAREERVRAEVSASLAAPGADRRAALLSYYGYLAEREGALAVLAEY